MLTALFADIHSNLAALQACLHHARARGAERFVFLADLVGYGPDPAAVIDVIASIDGAVVVKGNHDEAIEVEPKTRDLNDLAYAVIVWTRDALSAAHRQFLSSLPMIVKEAKTGRVISRRRQDTRKARKEDRRTDYNNTPSLLLSDRDNAETPGAGPWDPPQSGALPHYLRWPGSGYWTS